MQLELLRTELAAGRIAAGDVAGVAPAFGPRIDQHQIAGSKLTRRGRGVQHRRVRPGTDDRVVGHGVAAVTEGGRLELDLQPTLGHPLVEQLDNGGEGALVARSAARIRASSTGSLGRRTRLKA